MKVNRWIYAAVGCCVLIFAGLVYAWSTLAAPVAAYFTEWSSTKLSFTFTICMISFCFGGLISGFFSGKMNVKFIMIISAIFFLIGFFLAASLPMP